MAFVRIDRVLSVSSEDSAFPAENLLKSDNKRKWKCKAGEKQASVILQLEQDSYIVGIDIGNEHSAFVEILVGRSSTQNNDFKVLLLTSSLMTLKESKDGTNSNGVRFFKRADLVQPTVDEKWDRVKIVCTQPFNKYVQYGLSFIVLHSSARQSGNSEENSSTLGKFVLKKEDEDEQPSVGTWFAKRKDPPPALPPGAAAAIRDASTPASIAEGKLKKPTRKRPKAATPANGVLKPTTNEKEKPSKPDSNKVKKQMETLKMSLGDDEDSPADDTDADSTYSPTKDCTSVLSDDDVEPEDVSDSDDDMVAVKGRRGGVYFLHSPKKKKIKNNGQTTKRKKTDVAATSKAKVAKVDRETKPFCRLLEGVTIVISGYQNPLRGDLRSKACSMGARYKADWDSSCTHLICAFVNTPKYSQVLGRGKIVKKEWIEECYNRRRRLPWRRFALNKAEAGTSSEEEIWEESIPTTSNMNGVSSTKAVSVIESGVNRRRVSSGSDTEEEIERVLARQTANKVSTPNQTSQKTDVPVTSDPFAEDTDVDSGTESQTAQLPLPPLPDFFKNIAFHIASDIYGDERRKLHRYITAYEGRVMDEVDGSVEYIITNDQDIAAEVGEEFGISAVSSEWIWDCSDNQKLIPVESYVL